MSVTSTESDQTTEENELAVEEEEKEVEHEKYEFEESDLGEDELEVHKEDDEEELIKIIRTFEDQSLAEEEEVEEEESKKSDDLDDETKITKTEELLSEVRPSETPERTDSSKDLDKVRDEEEVDVEEEEEEESDEEAKEDQASDSDEGTLEYYPLQRAVIRPRFQISSSMELVRREKKLKKDKPFDVHLIPGVRTIALSELSQKILKCVVGEDVTSEQPWVYVKRDVIEDNLELHEESSEFLPIRNEIMAYPKKEMLVGYIGKSADKPDLYDFFICVTEPSAEAVELIISDQQRRQRARLENFIKRSIRKWISLGSGPEVDENILRKNRNLLEVVIKSKYPILPTKVEFRMRTSEKARDGYMELITKDETVSHVFKRRIDNETQVTPKLRHNLAQTICTYPKNKATQYEYLFDINQNTWKMYESVILEYLKLNNESLMNSLYINRNINLYLDDYSNLAKESLARKSLLWLNFLEYMSFNDVHLCKGKMVSCAHWHRTITGIVGISYCNLASNSYLKGPYNVDEVMQAVHGVNPVLIWSFIDPLNPRLRLEAHREIRAISMCPFNQDLVVGGAINGQIIVWDIKGRIEKVESQEILTNAQIKYRTYMRALMGWMKDIHDDKVVRETAVSDLRHSHDGAVVRIQWISPFEEVGKTGKAHQFFEQMEQRSLQFMSAGEDGCVLIWDLLRKPSITIGGFRERRLKRLKQKPAGLASEVSPYRVHHLNLKPVYKINIISPSTNRLLPVSMIEYKVLEINYTKKESDFMKKRTFTTRDFYEARPKQPDRPFISKFLVSSMEGDFGEVQWEGRDFDLGAIVNSENCAFNYFNKFHDGPVVGIAKHPLGNLTLTVGGKIFALWSELLKDHPVFWRHSKSYYTHGSWYKFLPNRFRLLRSDGYYEIWCITKASKAPSVAMCYSNCELLSLNAHPRTIQYFSAGVSDARGNFRIIYIPLGDGKKEKFAIHDENIFEFMEREVNRKKNLLKWETDWIEKYVKKKVDVFEDIKPTKLTEDQSKSVEKLTVAEETKKEEKKETKKEKIKFQAEEMEKPGKYLEWIRQKEIEKEHDRIKKMLMKKKNLDMEVLQKQRKPLVSVEAENEVRRKKQRERIKSSEKIFKDTVAMLFPAIVKEKPPPPADPYAGGYNKETKKKCFTEYNDVCDLAVRYMRNTQVDFDFDWKSVLEEGRDRRKYLDNTFAKATHKKRYMSYKNERIIKSQSAFQMSYDTDRTDGESIRSSKASSATKIIQDVVLDESQPVEVPDEVEEQENKTE